MLIAIITISVVVAFTIYFFRKENTYMLCMLSTFSFFITLVWFTGASFLCKFLLTLCGIFCCFFSLLMNSIKTPENSLLNKDFREPGDEQVNDIADHLPEGENNIVQADFIDWENGV